MRASTLALPLCAALFLLCACSAQSVLESMPVRADEVEPGRGVSYYLPKKLLTIELWRSPDGKHFAAYAGELIIPDHQRQYRIRPRWDVGSHDTLDISLTEDGLLRGVYGKAVDQRADVVHELAKLAGLLVHGPGGGFTRTRGLGGPGPDKPQMVAVYQFDPLDPADALRVHQALEKVDVHLTLMKQSDCPTATSGAGCLTTCASTPTRPGIYYRLPTPYRINLRPAGVLRGDNAHAEWARLDGGFDHTVMLPNASLCMYIPMDRHPFVSSETSMTFERGMLTRVQHDKPSELLGFVRIPVDAVSTILAVPTDLLTLRIREVGVAQRDAAGDPKRAAEAARLAKDLKQLEALRKYQEQGGAPNGS